MQALSIYILMRLDEGETKENNLDSLLLATVTVGIYYNPFFLILTSYLNLMACRYYPNDSVMVMSQRVRSSLSVVPTPT